MACAGCGRVNRHDPGSEAGRVCAARIKAGQARPSARYVADGQGTSARGTLLSWSQAHVNQVDLYVIRRALANGQYARRAAARQKWAERQRAAGGYTDHGNEAVSEAQWEQTASDTRGYRQMVTQAARQVTHSLVPDTYADDAARTLEADRAEADGRSHPEPDTRPAGFIVNGKMTEPEPFTYPVTPMTWRTEPFSALPQRVQDAYLEGMVDGREDHERWPDPPAGREGEEADAYRAGHNLARNQRDFASAADYEADEISNVVVDQPAADGRTYRRTFNNIVFHGDGTFSGTLTEADDPDFIRSGNVGTEPEAFPERVQFRRHQIRTWDSPDDFEYAQDEMRGFAVHLPNVERWR